MTRTAHRTTVFALSLAFAWAGLALAQPAPETAEQAPAPPPGSPPATPPSAPAAPVQQIGLKPFAFAKEALEEAAFTDYNSALDSAQSAARKKNKSEREVIEEVRKDPAVVAALGVARAVVAKQDAPAAAREQVASALITVDEPGQAAELSMQTLAREPDNRDALNNLSQARYSLGQYRAAIETATRLAQKEPNNEAAYTTRALSLYYSGEYLKAAEDAKRALSLNKHNDIALATLRMAETKIRPSDLKLDAIAAAQAANIKAEYQATLDQRNQVEAEAARTSSGPEADPLAKQAAAKIASHDQRGAIEDASRAIETNPESAQAWYLRAAARNLAGESEEAAADATRALQLAPGHAQAFDARAKARFAQGRWEESKRDATDAIRLDPTNAYAFATRARAFEKLGEYPAMIADLQQAARLNPQFEPEYRQAAARRALPPPPGAEPAAEPKPAERRLPPWLLALFMLVGGGLIAAGLLRYVTSQWNRRITTALHRLDEARASVTPLSHDVAGLAPHFQIVRAVGKGGMGVVYEAIDKGLNRRVALKRMREEIRVDPRERDRFLEEARTVAGLHHPNIVDIHAIVEEGGELCLVFEYVSGRTVEQLLEAKTRLSLPEARLILRGACQALEYAHRHGVIHRDLKPSNIMLTDESEVKVMDFGIARHAKDALSRMTVTSTVAGTPPYMAPEADQGVIRPETDVYALGACLYEILTGERPFPNQATTSAKLSMSYQKPTRLRRDLPAAVDALIDAALQPDPDKRIPTAGKFLAQLEAAFSVPAA